MKKTRFLALAQLIFISCLLVVTFKASAEDDRLYHCPSVEQLNKMTYQMSVPYGVDAKKRAMKSLSYLTHLNEEDGSVLSLVVYPVLSEAEQDLKQAAFGLIEQLVSVFDAPIAYKFADGEDVVYLCAYSVPNNPSVSALAVYADFDLFEEEDQTLVSKANNRKALHSLLGLAKLAL